MRRASRTQTITSTLTDLLIGCGQVLVVVLWGVLCAPLAYLFYDAVDWLLQQPDVYASLTDLFGTDAAWALLYTLITCAIAATVALVLALPIAVVLSRVRVPGRWLGWVLLISLACLPLFIQTTAWVNLLNLSWLTANEFRKLCACGGMMGVAFAPVAACLSAIAFMGSDPAQEEAARMEASPLRVLLHITIPNALWGIMAAFALVFLLSLAEITVSDALWTRTYAERVFLSFQEDWHTGRAFWGSLPLLPLQGGVLLILRYIVAGHTDDPLNRISARARDLPLGHARWLFVAAGLLSLFVLCWPLGVLTHDAWPYAEIPAMGGLVMRSCGLAACGALLALFVAVPAAWCLHTLRWRVLRWLLILVLLLLVVVPGPLLAVAMIAFWNQDWLTLAGENFGGFLDQIYGSPVVLVLYYALRTVPIAAFIVWASLRRIPRNVLEHARIDGADNARMLLHIGIPLCRPAMGMAVFVAYLLALSDVGGTMLLVPPGLTLFSVRFATQIHFGTYPPLAQMSMLPVLVNIPVALGICWLLRRNKNAY